MLSHYLRAGAAVLFAASLSAYQADQVAGAEKERNAQQQKKDPTQKEKTKDALADLMGGPHLDQAAVERGRKIFVPTCGFCHGNDAHGKSGPDLVRSALVLHDNKGDTIGPVIRNGRTDRGMPAFPSLSPEQIADISTFLHSRAADVSNRFAYKIGDLITGDAQKGAAFFQGEGRCDRCHSPTGDLAHVASKYEPVELQRRMLYPAPNMIDMFLGKAVKPLPPPRSPCTFLPASRFRALSIILMSSQSPCTILQAGTVRSRAKTCESACRTRVRRMRRFWRSTRMTTCTTFLLIWRL